MLNKIKTKGFTILEVLVAVLVITVGVLAAFRMAQNITVFSRINASRLTATYLAQEGIELVRNQRDNNWLQGSDWDDIDMSLIGCDDLNILLKFDRTCMAATSTEYGADMMEVSVRVSWEDKGDTYWVTSTTKLYNWLP